MLTWPADQSRGRHRTLQLGGGGKGVGEAPHPHGRDAVGQLALGALVEDTEGCFSSSRFTYILNLPFKVCRPA